jgi:hypothetical protein
MSNFDDNDERNLQTAIQIFKDFCTNFWCPKELEPLPEEPIMEDRFDVNTPARFKERKQKQEELLAKAPLPTLTEKLRSHVSCPFCTLVRPALTFYSDSERYMHSLSPP